MAKQTRAQRRARRQAQAESGFVQRARARQQQVRPAAQPPKSQAGVRRLPGGGFRRFVVESIAELKKVDWPGQKQVLQGTVVVLIACTIVGGFLWLTDLAFKPLVEQVLLRK
jgi:preprotein translocase SecE subunit